MTGPLALPPPPPRGHGGGPQPQARRRLAWGAGAVTGVVVAALAVALLALAALPAVGGRLLVITSGSMAPTIAAGDAVILVDTPAAQLRPGDVITYDGYGTDRLVTHRVVSRHDVEGRLHFRTRGDANTSPDPDLAPAGGVAGEVAVVLPTAGWLLAALTSRWAQLALVALALALAALELADLLRAGRAPPGSDHPPRRRHAPPATWTAPGPTWTAPGPTWTRRERPPRGRPMGRLATIALIAGVSLAILGVAGLDSAAAVWTASRTEPDSSLATLDLVAPGNAAASVDCGLLGLGLGVEVTWDAVGYADGYEVARSTQSGGPYATIATVDGATTSYADFDVALASDYYYVVRATVSSWTSPDSAQAHAETPLVCL